MASSSAIRASRPSTANCHHCERGYLVERLAVILVPFLKPFGPPWRSLPTACRQAAVDVAVEDRLLVVAVLGETLDLLALDRHGALVLLDAVAVEHAHLDDRAGTPGGTRSEVSRTSEAFSPKMARSSFSSGVIGLSPFGVILPTRMSPGFTSAPI
jgi:hypothetical protein